MLNTERSYEINWKIISYRDDCYFSCSMWKYESYSKKNTTTGAAIGGAAGYMLGGNTATTLGGAALGGVIGSQVNK